MDEFKHHHPTHAIKRGNFNYLEAFKKAIMVFDQCPRILSLIKHASALEDSPLHCCLAASSDQVNFLAQKQTAIQLYTKEGFNFLVLKVTTGTKLVSALSGEDQAYYWLVTLLPDRKGFLMRGSDLIDKDGSLSLVA